MQAKDCKATLKVLSREREKSLDLVKMSGYLQTCKGGKARATKAHLKKKAQHNDLTEVIEVRESCGARS